MIRAPAIANRAAAMQARDFIEAHLDLAFSLGDLERDPAVKARPQLASLVGTAWVYMDRASRFVVAQQTGVRLASEALTAAAEMLEVES